METPDSSQDTPSYHPSGTPPVYPQPNEVAPGYPVYPQGGYGYGGYPQTQPQQPTGYGANYGYQQMYPNYLPPQLPVKRDVYRLVIGIISIVLLVPVLITGLLLLIVVFAGPALNLLDPQSGLGTWTLASLIGGIAAIGGGTGLYFTIRALMGRPSAEVKLPTFFLPLGLAIAALVAADVQYTLGGPQGLALLQSPLLLLTGILPSIAIFSLALQRLRYPVTWRHVWMSFLSGMFMATLLALIVELIASVFIVILLRSKSSDITQFGQAGGPDILTVFIILSVVAPLAEEGFKPLGPIMIIGRIKAPAEAFLLGMAAGIGFNIFETTGYISSGQADWAYTAFERMGSGLLHGVGAGMGMLGWYYIFRGQGVVNRYGKGFGALAYAVLQHGIFNGANLLSLIPGPIGNALQTPVWFFGFPETGQIYLFVVFYAVIIWVLLRVTHSIRYTNPQPPVPTSTATTASPVISTPLLRGGM